LLLSVSCITAVVILLLFYNNNKALPTWRFLTPNSAISILAVVAKSALLAPVAQTISKSNGTRSGTKISLDLLSTSSAIMQLVEDHGVALCCF